ncbi:MAG: hypothetical protein AAFS00_08500, partial [Bacteroidota bacterium]
FEACVMGKGKVIFPFDFDDVLFVLAPSYRSGWVFELDRWLQAGEEVVIGQHKKNIIKIKWEDDFALPHHARLKMVNDKVTIEPIENAELWILLSIH